MACVDSFNIIRELVCPRIDRLDRHRVIVSKLSLPRELPHNRLSSNQRLLQNTCSSLRYWGHDLTFQITWRHRSRDRSIPHLPFPIGSPLEPSLHL